MIVDKMVGLVELFGFFVQTGFEFKAPFLKFGGLIFFEVVEFEFEGVELGGKFGFLLRLLRQVPFEFVDLKLEFVGNLYLE